MTLKTCYIKIIPEVSGLLWSEYECGSMSFGLVEVRASWPDTGLLKEKKAPSIVFWSKQRDLTKVYHF